LPDFSEILRGEAVFQNFSSIFCIFGFPNAVLASASGGFRIVSDTHVCIFFDDGVCLSFNNRLMYVCMYV